MASLDNPHNASYRSLNVPGRPDQLMYVWELKMLSASDTVTVPRLATRSASADQSSCNVLDPGTGITATAADFTSDNENVVTLAGASAGDEVVFVTLHARGNLGTVSPAPA